VVDDFVFWHNLVRARFDNRPDLEILGAAYSGLEAVQKAADLQLDLERVTKPLRDLQATPEARCAAVNFVFANHPGVAWWFEWVCRVRPPLRAAHI